ncbi:MAG: AIR synthase-related protein, partial [Mycobacterium sp.]|nr:AIR synthase-related protein [Mycobacterium sp.]
PRDIPPQPEHSSSTRGDFLSRIRSSFLALMSGLMVMVLVRPEVRGACEMLGFDPLYVANEGKLIAVVPPGDAEHALEAMRAHPLGKHAALIGRVVGDHPGMVLQRSRVGGERVVTLLAGEQLPRIC